MAVYTLLTCLTSRHIQRPVFIIFLSQIYITKSLFTSYSALLFWYQLFYSLLQGALLSNAIICYPPQAVRHLVLTFIGGTSPVFMNPDRLPLTTSTSYRGFLYIDVLYCVVCGVLCCVALCCVLWRDGAWDGVVVLASFLFDQQLMRGEGGIMVREAASTGFGLLVGREKLQLKQSSPPPWTPPRRRRP